MTGTRREIAEAEAHAIVARASVLRTLERLKHRLSPGVRVREVYEDIRAKGETLTDDAVEFAYEKPHWFAGVAAAGTLWLVSKPVMRLLGRLRRPGRPKWDVPKTDVRRIDPAGRMAAGQKGE